MSYYYKAMAKIFNKTFYIAAFFGAAILTAALFLTHPKFFLRQLTEEKPNAVYFPKQNLNIGVEIASTPFQWSKGLMFRKSLAQDSGMLFIFPTEEIQSFWMKHTYIPLDIIFISKDKKIVDIKENFEPCPDTKIICPAYNSKSPAVYVLEVNAGFVKNNNVKIGDRIKL